MALTERNRNVLYQGLTRAVGDEEAVEAMLSQFPAGDGDRLASESFVRAEVTRLDATMDVGFATIRKEMAEGFAEVKIDLKDHMHDEMRRWSVWGYGAMFVLLAAVVAVAKILQ